jgi:hypothetical protein
MTFESLQRAVEAAGFATASDDNQEASLRSVHPADRAPRFYPASLLAPSRPGLAAEVAMAAPSAAIWGRAALGHIIPAWAAKG